MKPLSSTFIQGKPTMQMPDQDKLFHEFIDDLDEELELALEDFDLETDYQGDKQARRDERKAYFANLFKLQVELVKLQDWVVETGHKLVVIFEGRDAAGKGGAIKRITQRLNPRVCRVAALPAPNNREKTQWYFQRYVQHLPAAGEMVLFDRSWYNRGGVERVMGFCTETEVQDFFETAPEFEKMLVGSGIQIIKYWFSITDEEQYQRFQARVHDPLKQWKLSPMDLESRARWEQYTKAKEDVLEKTHTQHAPWWVIRANNKKVARLNCIAHLLSMVPYSDVKKPSVVLPERVHNPDYYRKPIAEKMYVPEVY